MKLARTHAAVLSLRVVPRPALIMTILTATALLLALPSRAYAADVTVLHTFTGGKDGSYPDGSLTADANGNFYGTTQIGGAYGGGTVFELSPTPDDKWRFSVLYTFTGGTDGGSPLGSLVFDAAGNAYATVSSGGANGVGAVFELSPPARPTPGKPWDEKVLYSFQGGSDGDQPHGSLIFDAAGNLYGTTVYGGKLHIGCSPNHGCGTVYELSPAGGGSWSERVIHRFSDAFGEGAEPRVGLVMDASGNLYGTTYEGGNNEQCNGEGCGSVFELIAPAAGKKRWQFKNLFDFNGIDGALSWGPLTLTADGALFGTTLFGGTDNAGIVFSLTQQSGRWKFGTVYNFDGLDLIFSNSFREPSERRDEPRTSLPVRLPVATSSQPLCSPEAKEQPSCQPLENSPSLAGSERQPVRGARLIHASHPDQTIEVSIRLRHKSETKHRELKAALEKPGFEPMSRTEYESAHGADPADLNQIKKFAQEFGLKVHETGTELARRTVLVSGTVAQFQKAFNVELKEYSHPKGNFRGRVGAISVPPSMPTSSPASLVSTTAPRPNRISGVCLRLPESKPTPPLLPTIQIKWRKSTTILPETAPASASASSSSGAAFNSTT
jgi:uncharacterized repeat protein (TIGR03803 family)